MGLLTSDTLASTHHPRPPDGGRPHLTTGTSSAFRIAACQGFHPRAGDHRGNSPIAARPEKRHRQWWMTERVPLAILSNRNRRRDSSPSRVGSEKEFIHGHVISQQKWARRGVGGEIDRTADGETAVGSLPLAFCEVALGRGR